MKHLIETQRQIVASNVTARRCWLNLTQVQLAVRCRVGENTIGRVELGHNVSLDILVCISAGLGCTVVDLLTDPLPSRPDRSSCPPPIMGRRGV